MRESIHSFIHSLIHSFIHSFTYSFIHSFIPNSLSGSGFPVGYCAREPRNAEEWHNLCVWHDRIQIFQFRLWTISQDTSPFEGMFNEIRVGITKPVKYLRSLLKRCVHASENATENQQNWRNYYCLWIKKSCSVSICHCTSHCMPRSPLSSPGDPLHLPLHLPLNLPLYLLFSPIFL